MNEDQEKEKDFFERRPFGIPKRYIFCAVLCLVTLATWFITHDVRKTMVMAVCSPFIVGVCLFGLVMVGMVGMMIFLPINEVINSIIPQKFRWAKWWILIPLWVALPLYTLVVRGSVQNSLLVFVAIPILVFMVLWFLGLFGSWIGAACEVRNPILRLLAIIGVLLIVGLMIAIGFSSKNSGSYDYDQYDRGDPTYFRR